MRLIDADELLKKHTCDVYGAYDDSCMVQAVFVPYIKGAPTIEAAPVVHGQTEKIEPCRIVVDRQCCSCGTPMGRDDNYCPNCGARMDGDADG